MKTFQVHTIGTMHNNEDGCFIQLDKQYLPALTALDGFSHLKILWWFSDFDTDFFRTILDTDKPYRHAPDKMGIFATRSPIRPNPIALTTISVTAIDYENGIIHTPYLDANDGTPLLDIKPYTPSEDRVETPGVPDWCKHWPKSYETSGTFTWEEEFLFPSE